MTKAKNRNSYIPGVLVCRAGLIFGGPKSVGPNDIRSDHMAWYMVWPGEVCHSMWKGIVLHALRHCHGL